MILLGSRRGRLQLRKVRQTFQFRAVPAENDRIGVQIPQFEKSSDVVRGSQDANVEVVICEPNNEVQIPLLGRVVLKQKHAFTGSLRLLLDQMACEKCPFLAGIQVVSSVYHGNLMGNF